MSMISAQIDELRKWAVQLSERENEFGVVVRALVAALCDAANTIWQLRDDLQWATAENAKLRELVKDMWRFTGAACKKYPRLFDPAAQGGQMVQPNMIDAFEQRMRELGVEVDG